MIERVTDTWRRANRRERYMIVALGAVALAAGVLQLRAAADAAATRRADAAAQAALFGDGLDEEIWAERGSAAQSGLDAWRRASWRGASYGIAAAQIQSRLIELSAAAKLVEVSVEVDPTPIDIASGEALRFKINANAPITRHAADFTAGIVANERRLITDDLNLLFTNENTVRIGLSGVAPVVLDAPAQNQDAQNQDARNSGAQNPRSAGRSGVGR